MKLRKYLITAIVLPACFAFTSTQADVMDMQSVGQSPAVNKPGNGMHMDAVAQQYGEPGNRVAAVGEPPITRWVYDGFTVYFEHQRVIHSVAHR